MPLPPEFLSELQARNDVEDVIGSYVNLKRRGRNLVGLCPFHAEKTASFTVYPETASFYCFGCTAGGDVVTFIKRAENLDYMEAVRLLASRSGMAVPEDESYQHLATAKNRILECNRTAARFYYQCLYSKYGTQALAYLKGRGMTDETIKKFGLGFAPPGWQNLIDYMKTKGVEQEELATADLAIKGQKGSYYDKFRNRILFPIIDLRGNVIGFGGRVMDDTMPKYVNTADTLVFKKSDHLYAMNLAKNEAKDSLILAEGYMDVIAMHQAGFPTAVAALGTAFTTSHAHLMTRYVKQVILAGDTDEAGQKAVGRTINILEEAGLDVRVITLTGAKDPDEYIQKYGADRFKLLLEGAVNDVEFRLGNIRQKHNIDTPDGRIAFLNEAAGVLASLKNPIERDVYASKLAADLEVKKDSILLQVNNLIKKKVKTTQKKAMRQLSNDTGGFSDKLNPDKSKHLRAAKAEEGILALILCNAALTDFVFGRLQPDDFITGLHKKIYTAMADLAAEKKQISLTALSIALNADEIARLSGIIAAGAQQKNTKEEAADLIAVIKTEREKENAKLGSEEEIERYLKKIAEQKNRGI